ncbi:MAG: Ig-like domain-containing protein [Chloroflexi bacterium]|nr:Ig-like domain-containing protein [Chloroflexota bacterium]
MKQRSLLLMGGLALLLALVLGRGNGVETAVADTAAIESMPNQGLTYLYFDPNGQHGRFNHPPAHIGRAPATADIQVNYLGEWTPQAQTAFEYAVSIWEGLLTSSVPIVVNAEFSNLGPGILGGAGPWTFFRNFTNAPQPNTWYPIALANARAGTDLNGGEPEIDSAFSSTFDWYYGTDGNPPNNQIDFVSVVLHELGHGLGFSGLAYYVNSSNAYLTPQGSPSVYSLFTQDGGGTPLLNYPQATAQMASALTSNNIFFSGTNANAANGGRVKLYAPGTWQQGSSYSHLDEIFNGTPHALMTYSIGFGEAEHNPGSVTLGMFADMGWPVFTPPVNQPPVINLPNQLLLVDTAKPNALDLWVYTSDETPDNQLPFTLVSVSNPSAGVTLDSGRYISINPSESWTGTATVTVSVTDAENVTSEDSFQVIVVNELFYQHLPLVTK